MVRRQIAQKKPLQEICETTIQRCCAPDADTGAGIGCDNMTMILIAILNGRTLDQWYDWVADRVESKYGYETPEELQQVFAESRILAAQQRAQYRNSSAFGPGGSLALGGPGRLGALARVLSGGGITFTPAPRGSNEPGTLSFGHDEDDDYEDDDEDDSGDTGEGLFGVNRLKVGSGGEKTNSLRNQLDDLENGMEEDEMDHDLHDIQEVDTNDEEDKTDMQDDFAPRANITLASPSEKQGMIDLGVVQDEAPTPLGDNLSPSGYSSNGKSWVKLSDPTSRSNVSSIGSPLVPIPPPLKDFGKPSPPPEQEASKTSDKATAKPGPIAEEKLPAQETGRVPDADAHPGLTNGLLDKSEDPIKA
jgi:protein phosphatase 2C family protein 2/3